MDAYYDSSLCQIVIGPDNLITLQAKGSDSASTGLASFTIEQLRETAKFGKQINKIMATEPDEELIEGIKKHWSVWKDFADFSEMETKTGYGMFGNEYNPWFNEQCDAIKSALQTKDTVVAQANRMSPTDDNYHIYQMTKADAQRKFDREWQAFINRFIACEGTLASLVRTLCPEDDDDSGPYNTYGAQESIGTELLRHYIRLIVQIQVLKSLKMSKDDDDTFKPAFSPSWANLANAFATCQFKSAASIMTATQVQDKLARIVHILGMLECHLTPVIMTELDAHSQTVAREIGWGERTLKAGDETFYQVVGFLTKIGRRFGFVPA